LKENEPDDHEKIINPRMMLSEEEEMMEDNDGAPLLTPPENNITSRKDFIDYIENRRIRGELGAFLQVVTAISTFDDRSILFQRLKDHKFHIREQYGNLHWLDVETYDKNLNEKRTIPYFLFFDEASGIHLFLTRARKTDEMPETILSFINETKNISNLWISPSMMHEIKEDLERKYSNDFQLNYFSAIRNLSAKIKAKKRPYIQRSFQYTGIDAKITLNELEYLYGVYPKIIEVNIGARSRFRIDDKGILTIKEGETPLVFSILDQIIRMVRPIADAVLSSRYERRKIGGIERWFQHPFSITMPNGVSQSIEADLLKEISDDYWQFLPISPYVEEEVPYLSSRFIDGQKRSCFDVEMGRRHANVFPIESMEIGSALRFCQFFSQQVDIDSRVGIVSEVEPN